MKHIFRILTLICLSAAVLTTFASADSGPKPHLVVRVENAPAVYYLDLLAEGNIEDDSVPFDSIDWNYTDEEAAALDTALLDSLRAAIPEGWHGCISEGSTGAPIWGELYPEEFDKTGAPLHSFTYFGVPTVYRILMVSDTGEVFLSDTLERKVLQCSATVDWAARTVHTPPVWLGYALQFLSTLLPTLAVEFLILLLFRLRSKRNLWVFLLVNLITQGGLAVYAAVNTLAYGANIMVYIVFFIPIELAILVVEAIAYRRWLSCSRGRATAYAVIANIASAALGFWLMEPVWRFVVSIS